MTNAEAIEILRELNERRKVVHVENVGPLKVRSDRITRSIDMAISALEKQEGKKPNEAKNVYPPEQFECPVCGCCVGRHKTLRRVNDLFGEVLTDCVVEFDFCPDCGQRIDWSDEHGTD